MCVCFCFDQFHAGCAFHWSWGGAIGKCFARCVSVRGIASWIGNVELGVGTPHVCSRLVMFASVGRPKLSWVRARVRHGAPCPCPRAEHLSCPCPCSKPSTRLLSPKGGLLGTYMHRFTKDGISKPDVLKR